MATDKTMKTPITFDATLLSPMGLRHAAGGARAQRDAARDVSASHFTLWANLVKALDAAAEDIETTEFAAEQESDRKAVGW